MSSHSLTRPLVIWKYYNFIFYDQSHNTLKHLLEELQSYIHNNPQPHIVAHSWGCFLFLKALELGYIDSSVIKSVIFLTPMLLTEGRGDKAIADFKEQNIPKDTQAALDKVWEQDDEKKAGKEFMQIITPYYHYDPSFNLKVKCGFDRALYYKISAEIKGYDNRSALKQLPSGTMLIYGDSDFIYPEDEYKAHVRPERIHVVANAGHYVFAEQKNAVMQLMYEFWKGLAVEPS